MLAASPLYYQDVYAPARPSPLSERPSNVPSRIFHFSMASQNRKCAPQRLYKPNPTIANRDVATQRRRDMFFRRVQNDRADKRWEARGDQIQRLDFIKEQKRWQVAKAQQAPEEQYDAVEEDMEGQSDSLSSSAMHTHTRQPEREMSEADYVLAQEQYELDALIASMEEQEKEQPDTSPPHFGSDDEEYDQIFTEWTRDSDFEQQQQQQITMDTSFGDGEEMDMS